MFAKTIQGGLLQRHTLRDVASLEGVKNIPWPQFSSTAPKENEWRCLLLFYVYLSACGGFCTYPKSRDNSLHRNAYCVPIVVFVAPCS
jgi:hypothetical protein